MAERTRLETAEETKKRLAASMQKVNGLTVAQPINQVPNNQHSTQPNYTAQSEDEDPLELTEEDSDESESYESELTTPESFMETHGSHGTNGYKKEAETPQIETPKINALNTERINQVYIPKSRRGLWTESKYGFAVDLVDAIRNDLYIQYGEEASNMLTAMRAPEFELNIGLDEFNLAHYLNLEQILDDSVQIARDKKAFSPLEKRQAMSVTRKNVGFFLKGYFLGRETIERESQEEIDELDQKPKRENIDETLQEIVKTYAIRNGITFDEDAIEYDPIKILNALPIDESKDIITAATMVHNFYKKINKYILEKHGTEKPVKNKKNETIGTVFEHNDLTRSLVIEQKYAELIKKEEKNELNFERKIKSAIDDDMLSPKEYADLKREAQHLGISMSDTVHDAEHVIRDIYDAYRIMHNTQTKGSRTSIDSNLTAYLGFAAQFIHSLAIDAKDSLMIVENKIRYQENSEKSVAESDRIRAKKIEELLNKTGMADKKGFDKDDIDTSELFKYALNIAKENHTKFVITEEIKAKIKELYDKGFAKLDAKAFESIKNSNKYTKLPQAEKILNADGYVKMEKEDVEMFKHEFHPYIVMQYENGAKIYKPRSTLFTPNKNNGSLGELDLEETVEQFIEKDSLVQSKEVNGVMHFDLDNRVSVFVKEEEYDALKEEKRLAQEREDEVMELGDKDMPKPVTVRMNLWGETSPVMNYIAANGIQSVAEDTRDIIAAENLLSQALFNNDVIKQTTTGYIVIPMSAAYNESGGRTYDYTQVLVGKLNPIFQPKEKVKEIGNDGYQFILSNAYVINITNIEKVMKSGLEPTMENVKPERRYDRHVKEKDLQSVEPMNNTLIVEVYKNEEAKQRIYQKSSARPHIKGNHDGALGVLFYSDGCDMIAVPLNDDPYGNLHLKDGKALQIPEPDKIKLSKPYEGAKSLHKEAF